MILGFPRDFYLTSCVDSLAIGISKSLPEDSKVQPKNYISWLCYPHLGLSWQPDSDDSVIFLSIPEIPLEFLTHRTHCWFDISLGASKEPSYFPRLTPHHVLPYHLPSFHADLSMPHILVCYRAFVPVVTSTWTTYPLCHCVANCLYFCSSESSGHSHFLWEAFLGPQVSHTASFQSTNHSYYCNFICMIIYLNLSPLLGWGCTFFFVYHFTMCEI